MADDEDKDSDEEDEASPQGTTHRRQVRLGGHWACAGKSSSRRIDFAIVGFVKRGKKKDQREWSEWWRIS